MPVQHIAVVLGSAEDRQPVFCALVKRSYDLVDRQILSQREEAEPRSEEHTS